LDELAKREADRVNAMTPEERAKRDKEQARMLAKARKRKGPRQTSSQDGYQHGYEAGKKMDINTGVGESTPKEKLN
jgi:hypothetical protein